MRTIPDLFRTLPLDRRLKEPLYQQLYEGIKALIENGALIRDYRLPSIRQLAGVLNLNQVTVVSAFKRLEAEGYINKRTGSGTFVAGSAGVKSVSGKGLITDELYRHDDMLFPLSSRIAVTESTVNFASATPTTELFPVRDFKAALDEVLERDKGNAFAYQESQGFLPLRESIAGLLRRRGMSAGPESIQVISGAQQGIDIISKALLRQGDCVITESPTYAGAAAVFKSRHARIVDIEIGQNGPDMNVLEYNMKKCRPRLIYTIPSFHNPTGYSCPLEKRKYLVGLAEKYNAYIIEDDYVSDLSFDGPPAAPIKALDARDRVIFIKSFSKIFMPGLRLGFMVVPPGLAGSTAEAKHTTDISTSGLIQRAFDVYIRTGSWDRHFNFMYKIYKERYHKMIGALDRLLNKPACYYKPGGGLNLWLSLPVGLSADSLLLNCAAGGVIFAPGRIFYTGEVPQKLYDIRLSFAAVDTAQIEEGIGRLCGFINSAVKGGPGANSVPVL